MADWVLKTDAVRESIGLLRGHSIHPFFPAYLHIRRTASAQGSLTGIQPDWEELGRFFEVAGAPSTHPYFRPFTISAGESDQEWLNPNIAGSYAPSSVRPDQPAGRVVEKGTGRGRFDLPDDHWDRALEHLLRGVPVPLAPLAGFFFRDYAFEDYDTAPDNDDLGAAFVLTFGYDDSTGHSELDTLFDTSIEATTDWFEEWHGV